MLLFQFMKLLLCKNTLLPKSVHLFVGPTGKELRNSLFQGEQLLLRIKRSHRIQQFQLRLIKNGSFHHIFFIPWAKGSHFSQFYKLTS